MTRQDKRICRICGEKKPLDLFERDKRVKGGRTNRCKACKTALDDRAHRAYRDIKKRALKAGVPMEVTVSELRLLYAAHDGKCIYCGITEDEAGCRHHIDHVTPLSRGGTNHISNLVLACASCNAAKKDKPLVSFYLNRDRDKFPEKSFSAVAYVIALTAGQPVDEVINGLLREHANYVVERLNKEMAKNEQRIVAT
ncbi:HNH endonuclease [Heyndrickxia coagulans]|uniref:HNH endonuclease n=1 Tax=Heyndrickxia coagulans TaxID=1398 RepID=UPI003D24ADEF